MTNGYAWHGANTPGRPRVEVADRGPRGVLVRYSALLGFMVEVPVPAWDAFLDAAKRGGGGPGAGKAGTWVGFGSGGRGRVEVANLAGGEGVKVRYSGEPAYEVVVPTEAWRVFLAAVRNGEFDEPC